MSVSDPVADMLTKIRNAAASKYDKVDVYNSTLKLEVVKILKEEGYIKNFKTISQDGIELIRIFLKYDKNNNSVIHGIDRISTPGKRSYTGYKTMPRILNGFGTVIVSTSTGVITGKKATESKIGGELICSIW